MSEEGIKATLFFHISCARDVKQEKRCHVVFSFPDPLNIHAYMVKEIKSYPFKIG